MTSETPDDQNEGATSVSITFDDSYQLIVGPPGARGQPETGRQVVPPHPNRDHDHSLIGRIHAKGEDEGLTFKREHLERDVLANRFDFGSMKNVGDALIATGSGAAALALLRGCGQLVTEWLKGRATRAITVKVPGGIEVSIKGGNDIGKAIEALERLQARTSRGRPSSKRPERGRAKKS